MKGLFYYCLTFRAVRGFTLIELLVVMSVIAIVSTVTVASFVSYSQSSTLKQGSSDVGNLLRDAKSRTLSQVKPSNCSGTLDGYRVDICGLTGSTCATQDTYTLSMVCSSTRTVLVTKKLPSTASFRQSGTTSVGFTFKVLTNGVIGDGDVVVGMKNGNTPPPVTITVGQSGSVTVH
ncbi:MAG: type II secretion system protein [Patescibacteria group bacterium]